MILQGSLILPLLFLIYISVVFNKILETNLKVISLFFVDDLGFIALGSFIKEVVKTFEEVT